MSWLTGWNYRKAVTVSNTGSTLIDYQVLITTDTATLISAGKMRSDCGDIRFTSSDGSTLLNYWIESGQNTSSTKIWIKSTLANGNNTVYMYYGNPSAVSANNGAGTFGAEFWGMRDFTTYTETDPTGTLTVDSATKVTATALTNTVTYLRKDLGSTLMTDFELKFDFFLDYINTIDWGHGRTLVLSLSDTNTDNTAYVGSNSIALDHHRNNGPFYLAVTGALQGSGYDVYNTFADFQGYAIISRVGSTVTLTVYTDAARTNQIYTQSGTQWTAYRYISIWYGNGGFAYAEWGNVQNVSIRKYASPEPTIQNISSEETPANITATLMTITPSENSCRVGICTVTVNVTWINNGGTSGDFIPNITIDGTPYSSPYPLESLGAGLSVTKTFVISGLVVGTRNICPVPN